MAANDDEARIRGVDQHSSQPEIQRILREPSGKRTKNYGLNLP